jgi:large subunit ribosomal protein L33
MAKDKREHLMLVCSGCGEINYNTSRSKTATKLELKKYCPHERSHQLHKEKKRK